MGPDVDLPQRLVNLFLIGEEAPGRGSSFGRRTRDKQYIGRPSLRRTAGSPSERNLARFRNRQPAQYNFPRIVQLSLKLFS